MARQANASAVIMSVRVNIVDLAKAGKYLMEDCGQVPTGRGSIVGSALKMLSILWDEERKKEGRDVKVEVEEAHRWLDARWPKIKGGEVLRKRVVDGGMNGVVGRKEMIRRLEESVSSVEEGEASEAEKQEVYRLLEEGARMNGKVWKPGKKPLVEVIDEDGRKLFYDEDSLEVYNEQGLRLGGMKWNLEKGKMEADWGSF